MKFTRNIAVALAALAFGAVPAVAVASGGGNSKNAPGHTKSTSSTSSTSSTAAYGRICAAQGESTKHASGQKSGKTPFAACVVALAQAQKNTHMSAKAACKDLSKKHVKGTPKSKGTPFSECMSAVEKMRHNHS